MLTLHVNELRVLVFVGLLEEAKVRSECMLQVSSRKIIVGVRSGPRIRKDFIRSRPLWGSPVEVQESLPNKPIEGGDEPLLVNGKCGRVKG